MTRPIDDIHLTPAGIRAIHAGVRLVAPTLPPGADVGDEVVRERPDGSLDVLAPVNGRLTLIATLAPDEWVWLESP